MKTKLWAILLMIICTIILSLSQILWKIGADNLVLDFYMIITNYPLIFGFILYGISGLLFIIALKGGDLTVIHPMISLSIVWVVFFSPLIFPSDTMDPAKWVGVGLSLTGVILIGLGDWRFHKK